MFFYEKNKKQNKILEKKHQIDALFSKRYLSFLVCFCGQFAVLSVPSGPVSSLMYTYCDLLVRHVFGQRQTKKKKTKTKQQQQKTTV